MRNIRLTEQEFAKIITESVQKVLNEMNLDDFELPNDWFYSPAEKAAMEDIANDPESLEQRADFMRDLQTMHYVNPNKSYDLVNDDGDVIGGDRKILRSVCPKYNGKMRVQRFGR